MLSIQQPFADFVFHTGKWCENRTWKTDYRGTLYVHASRLDKAEVESWRDDGVDLSQHIAMQTGAIIGAVELFDCVPSADLHLLAPKAFRKDWLYGKSKDVPDHLRDLQTMLADVDEETWEHVDFEGSEYHWIFTDARLLAEPVPAKGKLNVWQFPFDERLSVFSEPVVAGE